MFKFRIGFALIILHIGMGYGLNLIQMDLFLKLFDGGKIVLMSGPIVTSYNWFWFHILQSVLLVISFELDP